MEEHEEAGGGAYSQDNRGGIRDITEELLMKLTGCQSLSLVRALNLSSSSGDKHIKSVSTGSDGIKSTSLQLWDFSVSENLHGCQRLQVLNPNHSMIQRMERLNALTQLRELQLAHNNIQRIEGLEHLSSLQHLNLSHNRIDCVPLWLGKKLHSLHTLHLQHNLITSLYEMSSLRSLSSLSELSVSGNPASLLPHSRLFLLYHLRTLYMPVNLPFNQEERGHAHQRFNAEELQHLQREVDSSQSELSRLQKEQQAAVTWLHQQEETNRVLAAQMQIQQDIHTLLEQDLHTKSQLLETTTAELTRAFHRLYELEQELTFCKIDAKLSPLPPCNIQEVDAVAESPYISKARHIRNTVTSAPSPTDQLTQEGSDIHTDVHSSCPLLEDDRTQLSIAEPELLQFTHQTEQQAEAELTVAEETIRHRQQEALVCLLGKLSVLEQLRDNAEETQRQMDRQTEESRTTERETEELETELLTLDTTDPQHACVTALLSSSRQMLDRMSRQQSELEGRLDDMLSRIAMETQEIKELEQQLTDGQILANEVLQKDLEGIISALQEYLRGIREQGHQAQQRVQSLQAENQSLQLHLEDTQRHCRQLEDTARTHTWDMSVQQEELSMLRMEAQALRGRQVESSRRQVELEAELQLLREELARQLECEALQAAADKEKQTRGVRESQLQLTIDILQGEKSSLQKIAQRFQSQLDQTKAQLHQTRSQCKKNRTHLDQTRIQLDQFTTNLLDPQEVQGGLGELDEDKCRSPVSPEIMLSRSVERLYRTLQQTRTSREQLQQDYNHSQEQIARLQTQLAQNQDHIAQLEAQLEAQDQDQDQLAHGVEQDQESEWKLKDDLQRLRERLKGSQSRNRQLQHNLDAELEQTRLQLQEVQQQRDTLLQQLRSQCNAHHRSLGRLDRKLRQLSRAMCDSGQLTAEQLKSAIEQLRALNHTVEQLHAQKTVDELDGSSLQAEQTHVLHDERTHTTEELRAKLTESQRHTHRLSQQLDQIRTRTRTRSRTGGRTRNGEQWSYVPPGQNAPSLGSQGTRDSGLGLQYLHSPDRGRQQDNPPTGGGYWVYIPPTHTDSDPAGAEWRDSGGGSDADRSSTGKTPPPPSPPPPPSDPAAGVSAGLSDSRTPLVGPAWLLCGSPAAVVYSPPAGGAALHCNIPEHRDMHQQGEKCECVNKEAERLEEEKKKLRLETKQLRHALRQHWNVMQVCDEVECVEKTLLKRRAELRQADRLLLEAQSCIYTTRDKANSAQREADAFKHRAQDSATCLLEAKEHIRELQEEVGDLRRRRQEEELTLREVKEALRSRDQELQQLATKIHSSTERLSNVLSDCQEAQKRLDSVNSQVKQQEQRLVQRREEHRTALDRAKEIRREEQQLRNAVKELLQQQEVLFSKRRSTVSALREEEQKVLTLQSELSKHRAELKQVLQELLIEQQALEEVKKKRTQTLQRLHRTKDELDRKQDKVDQMKIEVDEMKEKLDRMKVELKKKQQEVNRKMDELDKAQDQVDRKREELAVLQQQVESHRKEAELRLKNTKQQRTELQELKEELSMRREERSSLQEQCKHLEARRRHADRCLSAVEAEFAKQREEHSHTQVLKEEVVRDTTATQEQLNQSSELLTLLGEQVEERKKQLQTLEQQQQQRGEQLKELEKEIEYKQVVCDELEDVKAAVCRLEDRGRCLTELQLQLNQLTEEVWEREKRLLREEEGLKQQREALQQRHEELHVKEEEIQKQEEQHENQEEDDSREESFYLSTAGLKSAISTEEEWWNAELQRESLRQEEDRLKACLRCRLWNQQENLNMRRLDTEESLLGLKHRLDQLDLLLTHTH